MGASYSTCDSPTNPAFAHMKPAEKERDSVNVKLQQPVKYEEIQREAYSSLKWESIEGAKFDIVKPLNPNFFLSHRLGLGMREVDIGDPTKVVRTPSSDYNFSATVANEQFLLMGTLAHTGVLMSKAVYRASESLSAKWESRIDPAAYEQLVYMADLDLTQPEWTAQVKAGMGGFYGVNAMLAVTPRISGGAEAFYLSNQKRSGVGLALRYADGKAVATAQIATTGVVSMTYHQRVSDKAAVAADFLVNTNMNEATASVGYDYTFRQCRLRGCIDSNGKVAAFLEEQLGPSIKLLLSGELDHSRQDHKFGFGMSVGE